jgi:hypothetical protein
MDALSNTCRQKTETAKLNGTLMHVVTFADKKTETAKFNGALMQ